MKPVPIQPGSAAPTQRLHWRVSQLFSAPHRLGFSAAALLMTLAAIWWASVLFARDVGWPVPWAVTPAVAHGALMSLGFMPLFIVGFLFTAGPRWLQLDDVPVGSLRGPVILMLAGWLLALPGFHIGAPLTAVGVAMATLGWGTLVRRFARMWRASASPDTLHAGMITLAASIGVAAMALVTAGFALQSVITTRVGIYVALWGFLAPAFVTVSHRMIPFFTSGALPGRISWRPNPLLWLLVVPLWMQGFFGLTQLFIWPLPAAARWSQVAFELPTGLAMLWIAWRWGLIQSLKIRLLAMLHAGFLWLGLSLLLSGGSHGLMAVSGDADSFGLAPVHALTIGFMGTTMIAMTTRVAIGHSGRTLSADNIAWGLYWCVQLAVLLRVGAALWPAAHNFLTLAAISCWTIGVSGWACRHGNWFGRPRVDGQPG